MSRVDFLIPMGKDHHSSYKKELRRNTEEAIRHIESLLASLEMTDGKS